MSARDVFLISVSTSQIAANSKVIASNSNLLTGALIQTPLLVGGCLVHTFFCIEPDERPNFYLSTGIACILVGLAANAVFFTRS